MPHGEAKGGRQKGSKIKEHQEGKKNSDLTRPITANPFTAIGGVAGWQRSVALTTIQAPW